MNPGIPPALASALSDPDEPILLLVAAEAGPAAASVAVHLAEGRAADGRPTILADGDVRDPRLHEYLGVENPEGLADVFLFGASLTRVTTRPPDRSFDFIPTGPYVPDPTGVMDSQRWPGLAADLRGSECLLMLYVPAGTPGLGALSRRVRRAVLIGDADGARRAAERLDSECLVEGIVDPATLDGLEPVVPSLLDESPLTEPPVVRKEAGSRRKWVGLAALVALVLGLFAGGWFLYQTYYSDGAEAVGPDPTVEAPEPAPAARGEPVETPIPVSVAVEAHQDLVTAQERVAALRNAEPRVGFFLAPIAVSGGVYYRLLAGPVADAETGTALLQRLVDAGHKTAFDSWAVRPTQYAFRLGEYDSEEDAAGRVEQLAAVQIPSYVVRIRYEPGAPRYRVYGGAFETTGEADVMRQMLEDAELEAELVPRTGEPIA